MDNHIRGGAVGGNRNVIDVGYSEKCLDVGVVRLGFQGVPEEDYHINLSLCNLGANLLVAAERARKVSLYGQVGCLCNELCSCAGATEVKFFKCGDVFQCPVYDFCLFVIVCNQGDCLSFLLFHFCPFCRSH